MEAVTNSIFSPKPAVKRTVAYKMWKQSLYKWDQYVQNRRMPLKKIDDWSRRIVDHCHGNVAVYNSGGMFFRDFIDPITVIEHDPCPVPLAGMCYLAHNADYTNQFDSLIMINPVSAKYHHSLADFLTKPGVSRAGNKPSILPWLRASGTMFLSFSDWHMFFDRLRLSPEQAVYNQIDQLDELGLKLIYCRVDPSDTDPVNGNVKLIFKKSSATLGKTLVDIAHNS
jgi:hypothetical protein